MLGSLTRSRSGDTAAECDLKHLLLFMAAAAAAPNGLRASVDTEAEARALLRRLHPRPGPDGGAGDGGREVPDLRSDRISAVV